MDKNKSTQAVFTKESASELIEGKLARYFGVTPAEARKDQIYKAVVMSVRDIMLEKRHAFHLKTKTAKAKKPIESTAFEFELRSY